MLIINGIRFETPDDAFEFYNIDDVVVRARLRAGWHINDAYSKPIMNRKESKPSYKPMTANEFKQGVKKLASKKVSKSMTNKPSIDAARMTDSILRMDAILNECNGKRPNSEAYRSRY